MRVSSCSAIGLLNSSPESCRNFDVKNAHCSGLSQPMLAALPIGAEGYVVRVPKQRLAGNAVSKFERARC